MSPIAMAISTMSTVLSEDKENSSFNQCSQIFYNFSCRYICHHICDEGKTINELGALRFERNRMGGHSLVNIFIRTCYILLPMGRENGLGPVLL